MPTKYSQEKISDPRIPARKNFGPTKYPRENNSDPQCTQQKNFWTHEVPTRKNFRPTKYPQEKYNNHLNPQREDGKMAWDPQVSRWHNTHGI